MSRIDELVMVRVKGKGDLYVHQDANWNVIGLTDLGGRLVERHLYTPYGELTVHQETGFGDYDGDQDVDSTDRAAIEAGGDCLGGTPPVECRVLDFDYDGDWDSDDRDAFDALDQGEMTHPGRIATNVDQPFAHQGLLFEPEIGSYQNRARQYDPMKRRFAQRDQLGFNNARATLVRRPALSYLDGLNSYAYLTSNPTGRLDPPGTFGCSGASTGFSFVHECCGGTLPNCTAEAQAKCCNDRDECPCGCKYSCDGHVDSTETVLYGCENPEWGLRPLYIIVLECTQACS